MLLVLSAVVLFDRIQSIDGIIWSCGLHVAVHWLPGVRRRKLFMLFYNFLGKKETEIFVGIMCGRNSDRRLAGRMSFKALIFRGHREVVQSHICRGRHS